MLGKNILLLVTVFIINFGYVPSNAETGYQFIDQFLEKINIYAANDDLESGDEYIKFYQHKYTQENLFSQLGVIFVDMTLELDGCRININGDLGEPQPLLIRPKTSEFFYPNDRSGVIKLKKNQQIELHCTNGFSSPSEIDRTVSINCEGGKQFRLNGRFYNFNKFTCRNFPLHSARQRPSSSCYDNGSYVDIGFQVDTRFLSVMTVCHNPSAEQTFYTKYQLTPANIGFQRAFPRPSFIQGDFFPGKNINNLYKRITQRETIARTIGSLAMADQLVPQTTDSFLARGHLAAKGDFIYGNEQRATFYFINAAPQWQSFNAHNWAAIEDGSRRLAADRNITLDVYTGTHGIIQLTDPEGCAHSIFLDSNRKMVPVPKIYYKILHNRAANSGIVFIGVNNIHLTMNQIHQEYVLCNDVADRIRYITWRRNDIRRGYSYACDVNEFLQKVPHISGMKVQSLLI